MSKKTNSSKTRDKVKEAADSLFVSKGFEGTSMSAIARSAGVNKSLIYHHFSSKEMLWREVLFDHMDRFLPPLFDAFSNPQEIKLEFFKNAMKSIFNSFQEHPDTARIFQWASLEQFQDDNKGRESADRWIYLQTLTEKISQGQKRGVLRDDIPAMHLAVALVGMITIWFQARDWMLILDANPSPIVYNDQNCFESLVKLFFQGALPRNS